MVEEYKVLELFSGIGGMHEAFIYSNLQGQVMFAVDINTVANSVYEHNHPKVPIYAKNIQKLSTETINKSKINMILMSPPCQPHTRQGLKKDIDDKRSDALQHITQIIPDLVYLKYILLENVKGFEGSIARDTFTEALKKAGFFYREFILSPIQFGVPNNRHRYYCLARKEKDFSFDGNKILEELPMSIRNEWQPTPLETLLDDGSEDHLQAYVPLEDLSKRIWVMDIVHPKSKYTMCFTKSYTHYHEGTGSIISSLDEVTLKRRLEELREFERNNKGNIDESTQNERFKLLRKLQLRFFTPQEVKRLMSFPNHFEFPQTTTTRQKYRLLGNSINVKVVGELIKILCS